MLNVNLNKPSLQSIGQKRELRRAKQIMSQVQGGMDDLHSLNDAKGHEAAELTGKDVSSTKDNVEILDGTRWSPSNWPLEKVEGYIKTDQSQAPEGDWKEQVTDFEMAVAPYKRGEVPNKPKVDLKSTVEMAFHQSGEMQHFHMHDPTGIRGKEQVSYNTQTGTLTYFNQVESPDTKPSS